jgi:hypothetical protein
LPDQLKDTPFAAKATPSLKVGELVNEAEAARLTGLSVKTLRQYRTARNTGRRPNAGPEFVKVGFAVFYTTAAIAAFNSRWV